MEPQVSCCATPGRTTCQPGAHDFEAETWRSLAFWFDEPFRYRYEFVSSGIGRSAKFLARAVGDPTCAGKEQVWEISARVMPDGRVVPTAADQKEIIRTGSGLRRVR